LKQPDAMTKPCTRPARRRRLPAPVGALIEIVAPHLRASTLMAGLAVLAVLAVLPPPALAQQPWPNRPMRLIVPFPPGGPTDLIGRTAARILSDTLGQPVLVENRAGGSGVTGVDALARSAPDGYTVGLTAITLATAPHLGPVPFDSLRDFSFITNLVITTPLIDAHPSFPASNLAELVALARSQPGALQYGTPGVATVPHLAAEMLQAAAGIKLVHVPYKGTAQLTGDLLAGVIRLNFESSLVLALPNIRAGKLKPIAVIGSKRAAMLPDVPTIAESGFPDIHAEPWFGLGAPAGLAAGQRQRMNEALVRGMQSREVIERFAAVGAEVRTTTPEAFEAFVRSEYTRWGEVIRRTGIQGER
jgi:tripartite-type tricarboxylate transporter receptor subunit TctC